MNYITTLTKRDSIQGKLNGYSEKGYKLHTCIKQEDKFTYLLIFEKL